MLLLWNLLSLENFKKECVELKSNSTIEKINITAMNTFCNSE